MNQITLDAPTPQLQVKVTAMAFVRANKVRSWGLAVIKGRNTGAAAPRYRHPLMQPELFECVVSVPDLYIVSHKIAYHDPAARRLDEGMHQRMHSQVHLQAHYAWTAKMNDRMKQDPEFNKEVTKMNAIGEFKDFSFEILPLPQ